MTFLGRPLQRDVGDVLLLHELEPGILTLLEDKEWLTVIGVNESSLFLAKAGILLWLSQFGGVVKELPLNVVVAGIFTGLFAIVLDDLCKVPLIDAVLFQRSHRFVRPSTEIYLLLCQQQRAVENLTQAVHDVFTTVLTIRVLLGACGEHLTTVRTDRAKFVMARPAESLVLDRQRWFPRGKGRPALFAIGRFGHVLNLKASRESVTGRGSGPLGNTASERF